MNGLREIEYILRLKAHETYELCDTNNENDERIQNANHLVDLADFLEQLNKVESICTFDKAINEMVDNAPYGDGMLALYDKCFYIHFNGHTTAVPFDAVSFNAILDALKIIQDN